MSDLTPEVIGLLRRILEEQAEGMRPRVDHDWKSHDSGSSCPACDDDTMREALPACLAAAEENARLRAVVETAKADLQRIIDGTLMELESERSGLAANSLDPDEHDRRYYVARHEGALEQLEFLWTALRGMAERHGLRAALDAK